MNMRLIVILSSLISVTIDMYAMWAKVTNWFEDPTKYVALVNRYDEGKEPTASLIVFQAKQKRMLAKYNIDNKCYLVGTKSYIFRSTIFLPISLMEDWKESQAVEVDVQNNGRRETFICDQKTITPEWTFERRLLLLKSQIKH